MNADWIVDGHAHILDPKAFPFDDGPGYKPREGETGTAAEYVAALDRSKVQHALLVQPSCYGYDNSAIVDAMKRYPRRFRSICMVPSDVSDKELLNLAGAGVIGVRFNLVSYDPDVFHRNETRKFLERIRDLDWYVEVVADDEQWPKAAQMLAQSEVKVLVDHFGMHSLAPSTKAQGFQSVLGLANAKCAVVKFTTPFSLGLTRDDHEQVRPYVDLLLESFGTDRCVWGSDWPFLTMEPRPDHEDAMSFMLKWVPDKNRRRSIMRTNALRLFGFDRATHD